MSKIHEALKKAHEERTANRPDASESFDPSSAQRQDSVATLTEPRLPSIDGHASHAPILRIEDILRNCSKPVWNMDPHAIVFGQPDSVKSGTEQFRTLRSRLAQIRETSPLKTIQVTSAVSGEGKTFVSTNLAQAIVRQRDKRVLLIDADLRRSRLHVPLGAPMSPGLSDYLRGEASELEIIQHGGEGSLFLIPGGKSSEDPSELLSNGRLKTLLDRLSPVFDWIILDSPPCLPVADAFVIADHCDGILFVVRAAATPVALAQKASQELKGRRVVGVVLNAVAETQAYAGYYYHGYGPREKQSEAL